ncbi:MAG: YbjQ family protein, partial [Bacteroidota bacterium]|nr:YbjQ family protein [Bacteroidota bacterium]
LFIHWFQRAPTVARSGALVFYTGYKFTVAPFFLSCNQNKTAMTDTNLLTTSTYLEGYKITRQLGLVRGITVRSRSIFGSMAGTFMTIFGGRNVIYTQLCERAREEALQLMMQHAREKGANAVINMRYDANEVMQGLTEVLAYGTAVVVEKQIPSV